MIVVLGDLVMLSIIRSLSMDASTKHVVIAAALDVTTFFICVWKNGFLLVDLRHQHGTGTQ